MKIHITSLALLALQNAIVSADTSSSTSDLTSRLESIKNAAAAMVEEISQKETELMNEEQTSQKESIVMKEVAPESDSDVMYATTEEKLSKMTEMLDTIPDSEVNAKVHDLMEMGKLTEAQLEVHNYLDSYIAQADTENKDRLQANKAKILRMIDEGFEEMEFEEKDMEELEFNETQLEGNMTFMSYKDAKELLEAIPDNDTNAEVHELIEEGNAKEAEEVIDEFFDKYLENIEDEKAREDMKGNQEPILKALHIVIEHEAGQASAGHFEESSEEEKDMEELEFEETQLMGNMTFLSYKDAKELLEGIPDNATNAEVHELIEEGKAEEAEEVIDEFFDKYLESIEDEKAREDMKGNKEPILKALHIVIEHEAGQGTAEYFEESFEGKVSISLEDAKGMIMNIPDDDIRANVVNMIEQKDVEGANTAIDNFFQDYVQNLDDEEVEAKLDLMAVLHDAVEQWDDIPGPISEDSEDTSESDFEDGEVDEESSEGEVSISLQDAKGMIMSIPDDSVRANVVNMIEQKDVTGADTAIDNFFQDYVQNLDDEVDKAKLLREKDDLLAVLHDAVEQWDDIPDPISEDSEDTSESDFEDSEDMPEESSESYDTDSEVEFDEVSSQFNEILNKLPDKEIRSHIIERIEGGHIDEAEAQFKEFLVKYVADMPQGHEKETASGSESQLLEYVSSQFQMLRDSQDKKEFEEETKEDTKEKMSEVLKEIAENQLLIEKALEKIGGN